MERPGVSVVIPIKNEAHKLAACLEGILAQSVEVEKIVVIDSGSTDGSRSIAKRFDRVQLLEIPAEEFNHGETRNLGVRECDTEFIVMTVGDARPVDDRWLLELLAPMTDPDVMAVSGMQVVEHSVATNPVEWFKPVSEPATSYFQYSSEELESLLPRQLQSAASIDDVSALYRRRALLELPFRNVTYGEDICWGVDALKAGYKLAFNPAGRIYHYHVENFASSLKKTIAVLYMRYQMFGVIPEREKLLRRIFWAAMQISRCRGLPLGKRGYWIRNNIECLLALGKGIALFREAEAQSDLALDALYRNYCGTPPVPIKSHSGELMEQATR